MLAVTFTTRAAGEMRGRLRRLGAAGVQARTFHSAALRQLRYFWPHVVRRRAADADRVQARRWSPPPPAGSGVQADQALLRDLASEIEWAKVSNVGPDDYAAVAPPRAAARSPASTPRPSAALFGGYEEVKRAQAPDGHGGRPAADRRACSPRTSGSPRRSAAQYKWFVVDEFQDVSPLQSALLDLWLGGRDELCVVGDPAQTIYSFAGANADLPARLPDASSPAPPRSSWSATTARPPRSSRPPTPLLAGSATTAACGCAPSGRPAPR